MSITDVECREALTFDSNFRYINSNKCSFLLGHDIYTYIYFALPESAYSRKLKQARLIIFKMPEYFDDKCTDMCTSNKYYINPLVDFFNPYSYMYSPIRIDCFQQVDFEINEAKSYDEIDITGIVNNWIKSTTENKGLLLLSDSTSKYVLYASEKHNIVSMHPKLRLEYDDDIIFIGKPLSKADCTISIHPPSD